MYVIMASWYEQSGWQSASDNWFIKFLKGINWAFNYNHKWFDYDSMNSSINDHLGSFLNSQTGAGLTQADIDRNEMQMQNQEDIYQRQVTGMKKAGLNPALMYQSGVGSAPSAPAPTQGNLSMSDLMNSFLLSRQAKLLDAQTRNTDADTDKKTSETAYQNLINKYYPKVTENTINKVLSEIGVNEETIKEIKSRVDLNELDKELKRIDKVIKQAEADESSAYFKAVREFQEAQSDKAREEKAEIAVRAGIETLERNFMEKTNTKMGSATVVAIASALGTLLSNFKIDLPGAPGTSEGGSGLPFDNPEFRSSLKRDLNKILKWIDEHVAWED